MVNGLTYAPNDADDIENFLEMSPAGVSGIKKELLTRCSRSPLLLTRPFNCPAPGLLSEKLFGVA